MKVVMKKHVLLGKNVILQKKTEKFKLHVQECQKIAMILLHGIILRLVLLVGGKLTFKHVKGGVKLVETEFTIKEEKTIKNIEKF